jgi:hypothetical protein
LAFDAVPEFRRCLDELLVRMCDTGQAAFRKAAPEAAR